MYTVYDEESRAHVGVATAITRRHLFTAAHNVTDEDEKGVEKFMAKVCLRKPGSATVLNATCVGGSIKKDWAVLKLADDAENLIPAPVVDNTFNVVLETPVTVYTWKLAQLEYQDVTFAAKGTKIESIGSKGTTFEHTAATFAGDSGGPVVLESGLICGFHVFEFNMVPEKNRPRLCDESDFVDLEDTEDVARMKEHKGCSSRRAVRKQRMAEVDDLWAKNKKGLDSLDVDVLKDYLFAHGQNEQGSKPELLKHVKEYLVKRDGKAASAAAEVKHASKRHKSVEFAEMLSASLPSVSRTGHAVSVKAILGQLTKLCKGEELKHSLLR